jgi:hypothetical protein
MTLYDPYCDPLALCRIRTGKIAQNEIRIRTQRSHH